MKKYSILLVIFSLVFASLACQALSGGGDSSAPEIPPSSEDGGGAESQPAENGDSGGAESQPAENGDSGGASGVKSEFPLPDGATNIQELGGVTNFQVKMSLDEAMKFYMEAFTSQGYTERAITTVTSETTFSMAFEGHASGKIIVVQGVDLGGGMSNVSIRLEED